MVDNRTDISEAVRLLALRLVNAREPAIFLLGAGCSMQYGLPGFRQLLTYLGTELRIPPFAPELDLDTVRRQIERSWIQGMTPEGRRRLIAQYVNRVQGTDCPAYLGLARLAKQGLVKAFVNMNFDCLLEQALAAEKVPFKTASNFIRPQPSELVVYKPHGSTAQLDASKNEMDVILDIAQSDLFTEKDRASARKLLAAFDVVILGYSGVDQKLPDVLMPKGRKRGKKLFLINISDPNPKLLYAAEKRDLEYVLATGRRANFESFVEELERELADPAETIRPPHLEPSGIDEFDLMTRAEETALAHCMRAAISIRAAMDVAETSPVGLIDHAREVYKICQNLASAAGVYLSSPEKYLLRCASILHDLGFFFAFCGGRSTEYPGWRLLNRHGRMTVDLLKEKFAEEPGLRDQMIPESYSTNSKVVRESLVEHLLAICAFHASLQVSRRAVKKEILNISVGVTIVKVRFQLLQTLFAAAENIAREHPFLPSSDPVVPGAHESRWAIEDPVLDLYLRRKKGTVSFSIDRRVVRAAPAGSSPPGKTTMWLLAMTDEFIRRFDRVAQTENGWGITLEVPRLIRARIGEGNSSERLIEHLQGALEEALEESIQTIEANSVGEAPSLLDLIMIYGKCDHPKEPRVSLDSPVVARALRRVDGKRNAPHRGLHHLYLEVERKSSHTPMEKLLLETFQHLLYPGWRFLARNWGDNIEATLTARATLDLGSSRFRNEVVGGLKHLLRERITWARPTAIGHDGCTLCTARLLYIFASARQLFPPEEFSRFALDKRGRNLNDAVKAILLHFLFLPPDSPAWLGVAAEEGRLERIQSPDYTAWAAWAITYCLIIDQEIREKTGEEWLEDTCKISREVIQNLAQERWNALLSVSARDLLSASVEEPHSFTLGQVAATFLNLSQVPRDLRKRLIPSERPLHRFGKELAEAYGKLTARPLAQLSHFYLLPTAVFLDSLFPSSDQEDAIVRTCNDFLRSPIWIRAGSGTGSWGFNVKNTSVLLTAMVSFWRYAFEGDEGTHRQRFEAAFARQSPPLRQGE